MAERQTLGTQNALPDRACGFDSRPGHWDRSEPTERAPSTSHPHTLPRVPSRIVLFGAFGAPGDTGRLTAQAFVREVFERFDALEQGSRVAGLARV